ncbi:MAG TPA: metal transporter [Actinomycetota bacterium]|nr:metal transporter [Actinomycetota bacterium]
MNPGRTRRLMFVMVPVLVIVALAAFLIKAGPKGLFPGEQFPEESITFGRITLTPNHIRIHVTNGGAPTVTVAQVAVDSALWEFEASPSATITRLRSADIDIDYPWVTGEPVQLALITSTGLQFEHEIAAATTTPQRNGRFVLTFALLGLYIGIIPVLAGMTLLPFLRTLRARWIHISLAFSAGILIFLGAETLVDAIERSRDLPNALGGTGLVVFAAAVSFLGILAGSRWLKSRSTSDARLVTAVLVAAGIGLHNLGEGLAVGAAYRLGEIGLGTFLVIGFAIHNSTEGLGIVSLLTDRKPSLMLLGGLGLLAGGPTILGAWTGAFFFSPTIAAAFLAIAAGAIAEVVVDVLSVVRKESEGGLASAPILIGVAAGVAVMYLTGLLVTA